MPISLAGSHRALVVALGLVLAAPASAPATVAPPTTPAPTAPLDAPIWTAVGDAPWRAERMTLVEPPSPAAGRALAAFVAARGGAWRVLFDGDTGVALRVYGSGIPLPGDGAASHADAAGARLRAERGVRAIFAAHLDLFAPGAAPSDLVLVTNQVDASGLRTIGFAQHLAGVPVLGGQLSARVRGDRVSVLASEALPVARRTSAHATVTPATASVRAQAALVTLGARATLAVHGVPELVWAPLVAPRGPVQLVLAYRIQLATPELPGRIWEVLVDAGGRDAARAGTVLARRALHQSATAELRFDLPVRAPSLGRTTRPAVGVRPPGVLAAADPLGMLSWFGTAPLATTISPAGDDVILHVIEGDPVLFTATLEGGAVTTLSRAAEPLEDAQIVAAAEVRAAKAYAKRFAPDLAWLDASVEVTVNDPSEPCNAYAAAGTLTFMKGSSGCENSARVVDVVHHEFGHLLHGASILTGVGTMTAAPSEGFADYFAATMHGGSDLARGLFSPSPLRDLDQSDLRWPDHRSGVHATGQILGGALWDLRKGLVAELGEAAGVALADRLFFAAMQRSVDLPTTYVEILAADDDDGDLASGVPHGCLIDQVFLRHGLLPEGTHASFALGGLERVGLSVRLTRVASPACREPLPFSRADLSWTASGERSGTFALVPDSGDAAQLVGTYPAELVGEVVTSQLRLVDVDESGNDSLLATLPDNPVEPAWRERFDEGTPLYCTDFEGPEGFAGWSHSASTGTDSWAHGVPPTTPSRGDPTMAASGAKVVATGLGTGYPPDSTAELRSPPITTAGHAHLRVRFRRWLHVEAAVFDVATVRVNGHPVWQNPMDVDPTTFEYPIFQDRAWAPVDLELPAEVLGDATLEVTFHLASDDQVSLGGWAIDDFCVVGLGAPGALPDAGPMSPDAGASPADASAATPDAGTSAASDDTGSGCGCRVGARTSGTPIAALLGALGVVATLLGARRGRRRRRHGATGPR